MELVILAALVFGLLLYTITTVMVTHVLTLVYAVYCYCDGSERTGARAWPWLRHARLWQWVRHGLGHRVVLTLAAHEAFVARDLVADGETRLLYAAYPHGYAAASSVLTFLVPEGRHGAALGIFNGWLRITGARDLLLALGAVNVDRESLAELHRELPSDRALALVIDGVDGMGPPPDPARPLRPQGFLKLAQSLGLVIVPVFFGGERELCWTPQWLPWPLPWVRRMTRRWLRLPFPTLGVLRVWNMPKLVTVIGRPLVAQGKALAALEKEYWDEMTVCEEAYRKM
jgi:hypothetical protein